MSATTAPIFITMRTLCTALPARTPRQLITVSSARAVNAIVHSGQATPVRLRKNRPKITATAAMPPVWVTRRRAQP